MHPDPVSSSLIAPAQHGLVLLVSLTQRSDLHQKAHSVSDALSLAKKEATASSRQFCLGMDNFSSFSAKTDFSH